MTPDEFRTGPEPAAQAPALRALWWAGQGQWERAHDAAQSGEGDPAADWVHAYLHRVEGDLANAGYWYCRAGRPVGTGALGEEWAAIAAVLLKRRSL